MPASPLTVSPDFFRAATPATAISGSCWRRETDPSPSSSTRRGAPRASDRSDRRLGRDRAAQSGPSASTQSSPRPSR